MPQAKQLSKNVTRGARKYLALGFALFFLAMQTSTLLHSHSGELSRHVDCTVCMKIGTGHDFLPATAINLVIPTSSLRYEPVYETAIVVARVPANSRSPPSIA